MKTTQKDVIEELSSITTQIIESAKSYTLLDDSILFGRTEPQKWSIIECLEHLNLYGDFYIPKIQHFISTRPASSPAQYFKPGFWGGYFAKSMKINSKGGAAWKMKTFKDKNPLGMTANRSVLDRFIGQQERYHTLLLQAAHTDLHSKGIPITITSLIKLRLGDALRFTIYHNERHWQQAERTKEAIPLKQKQG